MSRTLKRLILFTSAFVLISAVVILVNQTAQLVILADRLAPWLGDSVLYTLLALYSFCIGVPVYLVLRLPQPLTPPESEQDPSYAAHLDRLRDRLAANPHVHGLALSTRQDLESGLKALDVVAEARTREAASQVFVTTAISQNGSLDTFLVLAAQSKLVLEVARIYYQRPSLRDLSSLYSNVAATALVAGQLDDVDLAAQVQPIIGAAFGSAAGAIPGLGPASTLFINSVTTGAANAFLTLRVGIIAQQYCRATVLPSRSVIRKASVVRATEMLGAVALAGTKRVAGAIGSGSRDAIGGVFESLGDQIKAAGSGIKGASAAAVARFKPRGKKVEPDVVPE